MTATLLALAWSLIMAAPAPPLTDAQKEAEYDLVKVEEVLTPEQYRQRDIIPGWRPRAPLSDIERAVLEIVPGEDNPYLVLGMRRVGSDLTHAELELLGEPSASPRGFEARTGAYWGYWYEQIDKNGAMTGIWMAVYKYGPGVKGTTMVGRLFMGPNVFHNVWPGIEAVDDALKSLKETLSKKLAAQPGADPK